MPESFLRDLANPFLQPRPLLVGFPPVWLKMLEGSWRGRDLGAKASVRGFTLL